jgi:hypothetical protein
VLATRIEVADALDRGLLDRYAQQALRILPRTGSAERDDEVEPAQDTVDEALGIARLLWKLLHRGHRHGFLQGVKETIARLDEELERRVAELCNAALKRPEKRASFERRGCAAIEFCRELFGEERAENVRLRLGGALGASL